MLLLANIIECTTLLALVEAEFKGHLLLKQNKETYLSFYLSVCLAGLELKNN